MVDTIDKNTESENGTMECENDSCCCSTMEEKKEPSLEEQLAQMKDQWIRAVAENENLRRRAEREKQDALKYAASHFARDMITITDYLEKALSTMQAYENEDDVLKAFVSGVDMTAKELHNVFERHGVKKINPQDTKFDPNLHQAMMEVDSDEHEPGHIVHIMQHGYTMHDRLLRPSLVGVAKKKN